VQQNRHGVAGFPGEPSIELFDFALGVWIEAGRHQDQAIRAGRDRFIGKLD
jgi:hypothetical protein